MRNLININLNYKYIFIITAGFFLFIAGTGIGCCKGDFNSDLVALTSKKSVILVTDLKTGKLIGISNRNMANKGYTIGSLAKIITAAALIEENIITTEQTYNCKGCEVISNKKIYCWNAGGHGKNNLESALAQSCNLFFLNYAKKLKSGDILKYYKIFIPDNKLPTSGLNTDLALGLDQKLLINPMEMLSLASASAGTKQINIKPSTIAVIRNGMILSGKSGTAKLFSKKGYNAAAKTGTAPYGKNGKHGWVIGYYPADKPKLAFCIFVTDGTGYSDAVPIGVKVLDLCKKYHYI